MCTLLKLMCCDLMFCFRQETADEVRISDWVSDVCSSELPGLLRVARVDEHALVHLIFSRRAGRRRSQGHPPQARDMQNDGRLALAIRRSGGDNTVWRAHVCTPVTTAHLVCRIMIDKKTHLL